MSIDIQQLTKDLYGFAENQQYLIVREFIAMNKLSQNKFTQLLTKHPELLEAYNYARLKIGIRREKKALDNEINTSVYKETAPMYDDELKEWELEKKKGTLTVNDGATKIDAIFAKAQEYITTESNHILDNP